MVGTVARVYRHTHAHTHRWSVDVQCSRQQPYDPFITLKPVRFPRNKVHLADKTAVCTALAGALTWLLLVFCSVQVRVCLV